MSTDSQMTLTQTRLIEGVWEGVLSAEGGLVDRPRVAVSYLDKNVDGCELEPLDVGGSWVLRIAVPMEAINDGVSSFVIHDLESGAAIGSFSVIAGETLGDDMRAELDLLRAELDMLKRAFRRHCLETM